MAVPETVTEPAPVAATLESFRKRNAALDALLYDVAVITGDEARKISPWLAWEGSILYVPPTGQGELKVCHSADELAAKGTEFSLAIAGVGSSALGSAAFARNIADATQRPVVGVVSGYGLSDLVVEAMGGWFLFGAANRGRRLAQSFGNAFGPSSSSNELARSSRDTATVIALLKDQRFAFSLLTGHSKGNLVLSEALYALVEDDEALPIATDTKMVTFSAAITMPQVFTDIVDVMGTWDWFGGMNSGPSIRIDVKVPRAWHHTNREVPHHLPVTATLAGILAR